MRQLSNPETIAIGALAGASASFLTTPADVVKSRLMTAAAGSSTSTATIIVDLISKEGVWALFKVRATAAALAAVADASGAQLAPDPVCAEAEGSVRMARVTSLVSGKLPPAPLALGCRLVYGYSAATKPVGQRRLGTALTRLSRNASDN